MTYSSRKQRVGAGPNLSSNPRFSEGITLRFDKNILERLRNEAINKQISMNNLINQVITQHLDWHAYASKAGFLAVTRGTVLKMLEKISEEDITEIGQFVAKKESKDFIIMLRNEYSVTSALQVLDTWLQIVGYSYKHEVRGSEHSYIIYHNMSTKWSLYLRGLFRSVSEDFGLRRIDFDVGENTLCFKIDVGRSLYLENE